MTPKKVGGLRTHGAFCRKSEQGKPLISIITVVRNGEKHLEQTIQSVLSQTYDNIEYIVVDGASSDGTLDIIKRYEDRIAYWISEPDRGIYDAMNKGSRIASGDYALYLNADDYLFRDDSIEKTLDLSSPGSEKPLLIVGRIVYAVRDKVISDWVYPSSEAQISKYDPPHQGTLIASKIYKQVPYCDIFTIAGDYHFWATLRRSKLFQVRYVDNIVSVFRLGGASSDGNGEYVKGIEKHISRYIQSRQFGTAELLAYFVRATVKKCFSRAMGESLYYRFILHNAYRLRRRLVR